MLKSIIPVIIILITLTVGCKTMEIESRRTNNPINIDGKIDDWDSIPTVFFEEEAVALGISNDNDNLYLLCRFQNPMWASTIRSGGLTFTIKSKDKKQNEITLKYNDGPSRAEMMKQLKERFGNERRTPMGDRPDKGMNQKTRLLCTVKDYLAEKELSLDGTEGPAAAFDTSMGFYTYEFKIPLTECQTQYYGIPNSSGEPLEITAVWGEMVNEMMGQGPGSIGGRGGGGMRPPGGKGGGMGGRPGMDGKNMQRPEKQELKLKIKLAE